MAASPHSYAGEVSESSILFSPAFAELKIPASQIGNGLPLVSSAIFPAGSIEISRKTVSQYRIESVRREGGGHSYSRRQDSHIAGPGKKNCETWRYILSGEDISDCLLYIVGS